MTTMETAVCPGCGRPFQRRAKRSNPKQFCDAKKCQKIKALGHEKPVSLDSIPSNCSEYRADIDYHGRPYT